MIDHLVEMLCQDYQVLWDYLKIALEIGLDTQHKSYDYKGMDMHIIHCTWPLVYNGLFVCKLFTKYTISYVYSTFIVPQGHSYEIFTCGRMFNRKDFTS